MSHVHRASVSLDSGDRSLAEYHPNVERKPVFKSSFEMLNLTLIHMAVGIQRANVDIEMAQEGKQYGSVQRWEKTVEKNQDSVPASAVQLF